MTYVLAYDVGTTEVKTCLFALEGRITLCASAQEGYGLFLLENGGAEQDPEAWWRAMCRTTGELLAKTEVRPEQISALSFCSQMQGLVLVDREGRPVRRAMSYMDQRAGAELKRGLAHGPQIAGANVGKLLKCLRATGAVPSSVKDPVWKYKWVQAHEPELFARTDKWLDVKEYLLLRCTGRAVMTEDSAYATLLYDTKKRAWSQALCRMFGVNPAHLPPAWAMTFGMPGVPSIYYGSEWGMKGAKGHGSDAELRPDLEKPEQNDLTTWISKLAKAKRHSKALCYGTYRNVVLTNKQIIFERKCDEERVLVAINAEGAPYVAHFDAGCGMAEDLISGEKHDFGGGSELPPYSAFFWKMER